MAQTNVAQFAKELGVPSSLLLEQLQAAGVSKQLVDDTPLTEHPTVRAISLTGSSAVGKIVGATAAQSFKHCSLELGGKNPMIVLDDANLDLAIEGGL